MEFVDCQQRGGNPRGWLCEREREQEFSLVCSGRVRGVLLELLHALLIILVSFGVFLGVLSVVVGAAGLNLLHSVPAK